MVNKHGAEWRIFLHGRQICLVQAVYNAARGALGLVASRLAKRKVNLAKAGALRKTKEPRVAVRRWRGYLLPAFGPRHELPQGRKAAAATRPSRQCVLVKCDLAALDKINSVRVLARVEENVTLGYDQLLKVAADVGEQLAAGTPKGAVCIDVGRQDPWAEQSFDILLKDVGVR